MGTRGAFGFIVDDQLKITFSQAASGPDDLGSDILYWLHEIKVDATRKQAQDLKIVHPSTFPTQTEIDSLKHYANLNVGTGSLASWNVLLHGTFSDPQEILDSGYMIDGSELPYYGDSCRWTYIVNFDTKMLEIYKAAYGEKHNKGRFAQRGVPWTDVDGCEYYPVKLVTSYFFDFLPINLDEVYEL